jgi:hypothetical protein
VHELDDLRRRQWWHVDAPDAGKFPLSNQPL